MQRNSAAPSTVRSPLNTTSTLKGVRPLFKRVKPGTRPGALLYLVQSKPVAAPESEIDVELLKEQLLEVCEHESELTDRVYQGLFPKRPDATADSRNPGRVPLRAR